MCGIFILYRIRWNLPLFCSLLKTSFFICTLVYLSFVLHYEIVNILDLSVSCCGMPWHDTHCDSALPACGIGMILPTCQCLACWHSTACQELARHGTVLTVLLPAHASSHSSVNNSKLICKPKSG